MLISRRTNHRQTTSANHSYSFGESCRCICKLNVNIEAAGFQLGEADLEVLRVLLTNTTWWPCASRLAIAFRQAGCRVAAVYPALGHPLRVTRAVGQSFSYSATNPLQSLASAIEITKPHIVIPCDDRAVQHLHDLHSSILAPPGSSLSSAIENSLGAPASYSTVTARYQLLQIAREEGLRVPDTEVIACPESTKSLHALRAFAFPCVLKTDGSWGGHGVKIVHSAPQAEHVVRHLSQPLSAVRTLKRLIVDRDPFWLPTWWKAARPTVVAQSYIQGRPANCAVVCWQGKVLAGIAAEVVSTQGATGSATVIKIVDGPEMLFAAERLAHRLGLSGFFGLDFVIEHMTGAAWLIEMNPRITPLCHLRFGPGRDLVEALVAQLSGVPARETPPVTENDVIAYFPQALHFHPNPELLQLSFQDVPLDDPELVRELRRLPWPNRSILARIFGGLRRKESGENAAGHSFFPEAIQTHKSSCPASRKT